MVGRRGPGAMSGSRPQLAVYGTTTSGPMASVRSGGSWRVRACRSAEHPRIVRAHRLIHQDLSPIHIGRQSCETGPVRDAALDLADSDRIAPREPHRSRCNAGFHHRLLEIDRDTDLHAKQRGA